MATTTEMRQKAAERLYIIGRGQTVKSQDSNDLDDAYAEVYAQLDVKGLTTWSSTDDIPEEYVNDIVAMMCRRRLDTYAIPEPRRSEIKQDDLLAELNIREMQNKGRVGETIIQEY